MQWSGLLVGAGVAAGMLIAAQGAINGRLASHVGGPIQAALISFSVGWIVLFALNIALRHSIPAGQAVAAVPWWAWLGGALGAFMVAMAATAVPRIGVAAWVSAVIAGQLMAAVVYDQLGAFGQPVRDITWPRVAGVLMLAGGVYLIRRY